MPTKPFPKWVSQVVILGAVWGLVETALGLGLEKCASLASGSIMTGVALFFIAASWSVSQRAAGVVLAVVLVSAVKLFDALLLSLPVRSGAVANPIFAFWTEGLTFLAIFAVLREALSARKSGRAAGGALAGLAAAGLFPLVKFATGIPACIYPGTQIPLSLYFSPIAVVLSGITVPFGHWAGRRLTLAAHKAAALGRLSAVRRFASPTAVILTLLAIALLRFVA